MRQACFLQFEDCASKTLWKRWKQVAKCGRAIDYLEPEQKHKTQGAPLLEEGALMTEFFAPIFPGNRAKPFLKQLKTLQDLKARVANPERH